MKRRNHTAISVEHRRRVFLFIAVSFIGRSRQTEIIEVSRLDANESEVYARIDVYEKALKDGCPDLTRIEGE